MFTGLVQTIGKVVRIERKGESAGLTVEAPELAGEVAAGDSVAINGTCLTATSGKNPLTFQAVRETLSRTTLEGLKPGDAVNMELSLKATDRLGGHFVQGHVDGVGTVTGLEKQPGQTVLSVSAPEEIMKLVVEKGSITVDGVSLTVAGVSGGGFSVALVPFTLEKTTLGKLTVGSKVNIETDIIGKYVRRFVEAGQGGKLTESFLKEHGFA